MTTKAERATIAKGYGGRRRRGPVRPCALCQAKTQAKTGVCGTCYRTSAGRWYVKTGSKTPPPSDL